VVHVRLIWVSCAFDVRLIRSSAGFFPAVLERYLFL
jgi:hypothetical protein